MSEVDKYKIGDPTLDRRVKLYEEDRAGIRVQYSAGTSICQLARDYGVCRKTIQMIVKPSRLQQYKYLYRKRGGWKYFYDREAHRIATAKHRAYKKLLVERGLI